MCVIRAIFLAALLAFLAAAQTTETNDRGPVFALGTEGGAAKSELSTAPRK